MPFGKTPSFSPEVRACAPENTLARPHRAPLKPAVPAPVAHATAHRAEKTCSPVASPDRHSVDRGLTTVVAPRDLQHRIQLRALVALNRFRVIRTFDIAVLCFAERPFKAALSAAQRAMRGLVKAGYVLRYRTDRFQHVYGLTAAGARYLEDAGMDAASSVRRVAEMTNPEHHLWASFIVNCCEVRGLRAESEAEFLVRLKRLSQAGTANASGLIQVSIPKSGRDVKRWLRPDALAYEADGCTWFEIDRSKRGAEREASLRALYLKVGSSMGDGNVLRRVVVYARSERIYGRAIALARDLVKPVSELRYGAPGTRLLREVERGIFEVWGELTVTQPDGRVGLVAHLFGHVIIQMLPIWLPKLRLDGRSAQSHAGWFGDNYLPYRRPQTMPAWTTLSSSTLVTPPEGDA